MKKITALLLIFVMSLALVSCAVNAQDRDKPIEEKSISIDVTARIDAKNPEAVPGGGPLVDMMAPYKTEEEKYEASEVVVRAKVLSANYVLDKHASLSTKSTLKILQSYKGGLKVGEVLTVWELEGFIPSDVFSKAISLDKFGKIPTGEMKSELVDHRAYDFKVMEKDEEVILYLAKVPEYAELGAEYGDNCYGLVRMWQGKLLYDENYDAYIPYVPLEELAPASAYKTDIKSKYSVAQYGKNENGVQARIFTLEEFNEFAESMNNR